MLFRNEVTGQTWERHADQVVVEHGTLPLVGDIARIYELDIRHYQQRRDFLVEAFEIEHLLQTPVRNVPPWQAFDRLEFTIDLTCRAIAVMRRQGSGRIIQNSSVLGFVALPYRGAYSASKYASHLQWVMLVASLRRYTKGNTNAASMMIA